MPENLYFREPSTQTILLDILFIYCKLNRDIGYRQGMHEVLAPVLWVIARDAIDPTSFEAGSEKQGAPDSLILASFDPQYIEHDAFTIFGIIMQTVKSFYEMGSTAQAGTAATPNNSPIVHRSKRIHEEYLYRADPELAEHLAAIEVLPQIFLIRWIRLLFGREFAFDEVLSLWDILFAEDPALDLVDLICVSMLLRIRWQRKSLANVPLPNTNGTAVLDADYSQALTLLLRYPVPSPPHGPSSFVTDALYLRQNLSNDTGADIIFKYSQKSPAMPSAISSHSKSQKPQNPKLEKQHWPTRPMSPRVSPMKFLHDQGGIEGIIQGAAKGVYSRGEKWGVGKVLRDAVQVLQSGDDTSGRVPNESHWSLDNGRKIPSNSAEISEKFNALEQRNKALAKLLETAIAELWVQQNEFAREKTSTAADAVSTAIAKVQFVQVYLENPGMAIPSENPTIRDATHVKIEGAPTTAPQIKVEEAVKEEDKLLPPAPNAKNAPEKIASEENGTDGSSDFPPQTPSKPLTESLNPTSNNAHTTNVKPVSHLPPISFHQPRPSLAQSSFSWMLGEDQRKSSFVSASPFPSEKRSARARAGFLFGDDGEGKGKKRSEASKDKHKGTVEEDEEVITLGDLSADT